MTSSAPPDTRITFEQFSTIFIPFSLLLSAALLVPETEQKLVHGRVIYSIWVTILFMVPALWLQFSRAAGQRARAYWLACWSAGLLAYWVHFFFTVGVIFHGSLAEVYAAQGPLIATSNLIDTAWWTFDVILGWALWDDRRWVTIQRLAAHAFIALTFFISAVVIKHGVVRGLGIAMTAAALVGAGLGVARWVQRRRTPAGAAVAFGTNSGA
jgi:hypothetical protein